MYEEAIKIWKKSLGEEHVDVVAGLSNLGYLLQQKVSRLVEG